RMCAVHAPEGLRRIGIVVKHIEPVANGFGPPAVQGTIARAEQESSRIKRAPQIWPFAHIDESARPVGHLLSTEAKRDRVLLRTERHDEIAKRLMDVEGV